MQVIDGTQRRSERVRRRGRRLPILFAALLAAAATSTPATAQGVDIEIQYENDFSVESLDDFETVDQGTISAPSDWRVADGRLCQWSNIYDALGNSALKLGTMLIHRESFDGDASIGVRIQNTDNDGSGLVFGYLDERNYLRVSVDLERSFLRIARIENGAATILAANESFTPEYLDSFYLTVQRQASRLAVWINETRVLTAVDESFMAGRFGLYSWGSVGLCFDDLMVYRGPLTVPRHEAPAFESGIMAGEVRSDSVLIWSRTDGPDPVVVRFGTDPGNLDRSSAVIVPDVEDDFTFQTELAGLEPFSRYHYQVVIRPGPDEVVSPVGQFVTAPAPGERVAFRLGFSGDVNGDDGDTFTPLADEAFDLYLAIGDWPYADSSPAANSLADYRAKHRRDRDASETHRFMRSTTIHAIYDDHEILNDWDGADTAQQPSRVAAGIRAMHEYFPFRYTGSDDIYRRVSFGAGVDLFILDTRRYRAANSDPDGPGKTMLGTEQRRWLLDGLAASAADFKLIVSSVPLDHGTTGNDHWAGFRNEREQIRSHIVDSGISGVIFVTTDQHWLSVNQYPDGIREYETGPISAGLRTPPPVPAYVRAQQAVPNYGVLEYAPGNEGDPPSLQFSAVRLEDGQVLYSEVVRAGRGGVDVRLRNSRDGRWRITGAYFVEGAGDAILPNLAPGDYRIEFLDSVLSEALQDPIEFSVRDGQVQVVEGEFRPKDSGSAAIVFYDGFFADSLGEYEVIDQGTLDAPSDWHIQGGQLRQNGNIYDQLGDGSGLPLERFGTMLVRRGLEVGDGLISVRIQGTDNDGAGLVFGYQDSRNYYRAAVDHQRSFIRLTRVEKGAAVRLASDEGFLPNYGESFELGVRRSRARIDVLYDSQPVLEALDDRFGPGRFGLYSWGYQGLTFDDLIVRGPEAALLISSIRIGDGAVVIEAMAGNGVEAPELDQAVQVLNPIWTALDTNIYTVTRVGELFRFRVELSAGEGSRYFRLRAAP